jgi:hypothetical protein
MPLNRKLKIDATKRITLDGTARTGGPAEGASDRGKDMVKAPWELHM